MRLKLTLILDLLLKKDIIGSCCLQGVPQVLGNDHVHHVHLLHVDAILVEAAIEIVHQGCGQLALNVTNLADFDASDVVSDSLLALLGEQLLQLVGT